MEGVNPQQTRDCLRRVLSSSAFENSERMRRFLQFCADEVLSGRGSSLKESLVGIEVFDRRPDYDPRLDPIVRVEARRLRKKLDQYYSVDGRQDRIRIELPRGSYAPLFRSTEPGVRRPSPGPLTIAVLPFANLDASGEDDFFGAGLTQEIIHSLTRLAGLRVMAWTSAQKLAAAGSTQSVDAYLEGSVRRSGTRVRISAQLIESKTGIYVWSGVYERQVRDLLAVQEELAGAIGKALEVHLAAGVAAFRPGSVNGDAYALYLRGRHAMGRRTEEALRQGVVFFQAAIAIDSKCAVAHAGLADCYSILLDVGIEPAREFVPKVRESARAALAIDPMLAEAHNSLGAVLVSHDWNWVEGEQHFRRAIELNPGYAAAHHWYGIDMLALRNRMEEAEREIRIARELNPLDPVVVCSEGYYHYLCRDFRRAIEVYESLMQLAPDFPRVHSGLGRAYAALGRYPEAIEALERARYLSAGDLSVISVLGQVHGMSGNLEVARGFLGELEQASTRRHVLLARMAMVHIGLGDISQALNALEEACERREPPLTGCAVHPAFDPLRAEPRFHAIIKRVGLCS